MILSVSAVPQMAPAWPHLDGGSSLSDNVQLPRTSTYSREWKPL